MQEEWEPFRPEIQDVIKQANWLKPGAPGWGSAILQEAYDALLAEEEEAARLVASVGTAAGGDSDDDEPADTPMWTVKRLRFGKGDRVACNLGAERGWAPGTVVRCFELPYLVMLDGGKGAVNAPQDVDDLIRDVQHPELPDEVRNDKGTPEGTDLRLWRSRSI